MSFTPAALHRFIPLELGYYPRLGRALGAMALLGLTACGLHSDSRYTEEMTPVPAQDLSVATGDAPVGIQAVARTGPASSNQAATELDLAASMAPQSSSSLSQAAATAAARPLATPQDHQGRFRVGNQTEHPIRIAFLPQGSEQLVAESTQADPAAEGRAPLALDFEPTHWDFAPGEGASNGLLLSLPSGDLDLHQGDVLVAFAQDGSSRYWGPYVVGQTQLPYWDRDRQEWQLLIQP